MDSDRSPSGDPTRFVSTKTFFDFPCCHRQHVHEGHCRFLHGYQRTFKMWFACTQLTQEMFVADFAGLKGVRAWLQETFDHTCLINRDDPELPTFMELHDRGLIQLRVLPNVGMEATSRFVLGHTNEILREQTGERAWCFRVETRENDKNSALYEVPVADGPMYAGEPRDAALPSSYRLAGTVLA